MDGETERHGFGVVEHRHGRRHVIVPPPSPVPPSRFIASPAEEPRVRRGLGKLAVRLRSRTLARNGLLARDEPDRAELSYELVIEKSNLVPAWFLARGAECARAIAKVRASGVAHDGIRGTWSGTGFLVSPHILLTNWHVLNTNEVAAHASAQFGYEYDAAGQLREGATFALNPKRLFLANRELDFAFAWVDGDPGAHFSSLTLARNAFAVVVDECVNIVQHPSGRPKELALQENTVRQVAAEVIRYTTDTERGSSGACVFNNRWLPVALHHASQRQDDGTTLNEGIRLAAIATYLDRLLTGADAAAAAAARELLGTFSGIDEAMGFFGGLGRAPDVSSDEGLSVVRQSYAGDGYDVDIGIWRLEPGPGLDHAAVAEAMARMNLDIWAFPDTPRDLLTTLVDMLATLYGMRFELLRSEAATGGGDRPGSAVLYNAETVLGQTRRWPRELRAAIAATGAAPGSASGESSEPARDDLPGLFEFRAIHREELVPYEFLLVPLGREQRVGSDSAGPRLERLAAAIQAAALELGRARDWLIAGALPAAALAGILGRTNPTGAPPNAAAAAGGAGLVHVRGSRSCVDGLFVPSGSAWFSSEGGRCGIAGQALPESVSKLSLEPLVAVRLSLADDEITIVPAEGPGR